MPLADEMRPTSLFGVVGQKHILGLHRPLTRIVESGRIPNMIFYGPPGVGKTTVAKIIAATSNKEFYELNATTIGTADIKSVLAECKVPKSMSGVLLYLDEIQYLNKKQQQTLLESLENGSLTMIASTTDNPYFCIYKAVLSRCTVFEFKDITADDLKPLAMRAFEYMQSTLNIKLSVDSDALQYICSKCGGDARKCLNAVELASLAADEQGNVTLDTVKTVTQSSSSGCDKDGDDHFDVLSAFQKSIRGSDPDAALHYAARLLAMNDLSSLCRRLLVTAAEDVGLAYPQAISITKSCVDAALQLGMPEARIPLAEAVILLATSPKSNSAESAIDAAMKDVASDKIDEVPRHLQNTHCDGIGNEVFGQNYLYPHNYQNHWVKQQYLPNTLADRKYYNYGDNKFEQASQAYWNKIKGE